MKLFVAAESSGADGDFSFTIPGELVHYPPAGCECPDCGCDAAMAGFVSHRATTSFVVRDLDIDAETYVALLFDTLCSGGWVTRGSAEDRAWVAEWAAEHAKEADGLPVETPLRFHKDRVMVRPVS